jgi:glycogen synthase
MSNTPVVRGLRVLMTTDAVGGVWSYALYLTRELCRRGAEVLLACSGPEPSPDQRAEAAAIPGLRLEHASYRLEWMDDPWADVDRAGHWLLDLARTFGAHLVHLNGYCHAALPWGVPSIVVAHSCVVSWWRAVFCSDAPERYAVYRERVTLGLSRCNAVVAPSASMLQSLREAYGYVGAASVIFNGASSLEYFPRAKQPFFLAAGRMWDRAKNLELVVRAGPRLPWPARVVGEGFAGSGECGVEATGRLARADLARLMGEASVFLHPARYEPFGLAPLEAALSGAALVLGGVDSLREIWGDAAFYVSIDDPGELVHTATRLASDPLLRHSQACKAELRARQLSSTAMARSYAELYELTIAQATNRSGVTSMPRAAEQQQQA